MSTHTCWRAIGTNDKRRSCGRDAVTFLILSRNGYVVNKGIDFPVCNVHREGLPQLLDVRPELADFGRGFVHALGTWSA